jgi:hypothetical protein
MYRALPFYLIALALALFVGTPVRADKDKAAERGDRHEGTVVSVTADTLVMKGNAEDGEEARKHSHTLADNARVLCDGKECKLEDLKAGQKVRVTTQKGDKGIAVRVEALSKNKTFEKNGKDTEKKDNVKN